MPELDLGRRRAETIGKQFVIKLSAADAADGEDHEWKLPRVLTQAGLRRLVKLAKIATPTENENPTPGQMEEMVEAMDSVFVVLFGARAEDAMQHLGPEDLEPIMEFYGVKLGESSASLAS